VSLSFDDEEPSEYLKKAMRESEEDISKGRVSPTFDNAEDAISWLNDKNRTYEG
jgi:uncharacterized protein with PhoU and TrkA domain